MSRVELGFRRLVAYTVGGVALLAFALILRALFTVQTLGIPTGADSPLQTPGNGTVADDPFGMTFFNEEGDDLEPAWSPDGRYITFVSIRDNVPTVVIRDLSANTVTAIASEAGNPIWSPDGTHLAYSRPNPQGGVDTYLTVPDGSQHVQVRLANAVGGIWSPDSQSILFGTRAGEIHIVSLNGSTERTIPIQNLWALGVTDVSPDGTQVLASAATHDPQGLTGLIRIDLEMGAVTELTTGDPVAGGGLWSPDGQAIAYRTSPSENTSIGIVRVMPAQGGEPHIITNLRPGYSVGQYDWSPDSRFVAYVAYPSASVIDGGELAISWADGSRSVPLLPQSIVRTFSWSPDGSQIAAAVRNGDQFDIAIVRADEASLLARLTALEATPEPGAAFTIRRLTTDPEDEYRPAVSPDGRTVAFARAPSGSYFGWDIYRMDLASGETQRLTDDPLDDFSPSWSPDGTRIAYQRMTSTPAGLAAVDWLVINADGSDPKVISGGVAWSSEEPAAWSPDSSRIAFMDGGSIVVYSLEGPREVARFTPPSGGWYSTPTWLPDGRRVAFAGGNALMLGDSEAGAVSTIASMGEFIRLPMWSDALSRLACFSIDNRTDVRLISLHADGSDLLTLARFTAPLLQNPAWSHDGRFIAYLAEATLQVTIAWTDQYVDRPPLFTLPLPSILVNGPAGTTDVRGISWLPASREPSFVFVDARDGQTDLYLATLDEAGLEAYLAPLPTPTLVPSLAPSPSTTPALTATPLPFPTLFPTPTPLRSTDFYWPTRLTNDSTGNYRPAVSPDGQRIAFASERDGNWDIYVLDRSSGAETRLTDDPNPDMAPSWSPDGARIAYQHNALNPAGPVLVDRTVMNADGSNKTVMASGSVWSGNQPAAWSPDDRRIAFNDSRHVVVVNVDERREVARFTPPDVQAYLDPAWFDDSQVAFSGDGQLTLGDLSSGAVTAADGAPRFARLPMTTRAYPRIGYFALEGSTTRLITVLPNGREPHTLAQISVGLIQQAAWSPDGRFIAYYADDSVYVAIAWGEQYRDNAPLFAIPNVTSGLSDLVGLSWLPDSSGFVYVASSDGQPDLFLATLNQEAIQAYVDSYPLYAPAQVTPPAATPPPPPTMTPPATPAPGSPPIDDLAATPTPAP